MVCVMGDADASRSRSGMENLSLGTKRFSRDLLKRFMGSDGSEKDEFGVAREVDEEGGIELNLGLSLGGRFGVDKTSNKLVRSSSIASCLPIVRDDDAVAPPPVAYSGLVRTSSLPAETEEEWRKRKELQTLRRMEAKRRRSEKQRNLKDDKEGGGGGGGGNGKMILEVEKREEIEMNMRRRLEKAKYLETVKKLGLSAFSPFALPSWAAVAKQAALGGGIDGAVAKGKCGSLAEKIQGLGQLQTQRSFESLGGSSSGMSELESTPFQGSGDMSPPSIQSLQEGSGQDAGSSGIKAKDPNRTSGSELQSPSRSDVTKGRGGEIGPNTTIEDMPCVFTKGDGPNGKRVDGILYKYGKGEEVRIMCVCHGSFHSPAEFVKHAGGNDVAHPLKHIVVNPNSSSLL